MIMIISKTANGSTFRVESLITKPIGAMEKLEKCGQVSL